MSQLSLPAFTRGLDVAAALLDKAEQFAAAKGIDESVLLGARLSLDMLPLTRQVQMVCDSAKLAVARLSGVEAPSFPDTETTIAALRQRIGATRDYLGSVAPGAMEGAETREVAVKTRDRTWTFDGEGYLLGFALPNFYFHLTTLYAILRHNGVDLGKRDYLGALPLR